MKVTLKDIAEDTGYSISTISRVLSGSDKISTETKDEVISSAQKLGYKLNKKREFENKRCNQRIVGGYRFS
jgi:DNA-binding LacI/PurR family transcriptional regulator